MKKDILYNLPYLENNIVNKTKKQKIAIIKRSLIIYGSQPSNAQNQFAEGFNEEATQMLKNIYKDTSYKEDIDWNWLFNADNIPNQQIIFDIKDFLENKRSNLIDALLMFNILIRQIDRIADQLDKPVDFINDLKNIPLNETQRYLLLALILFWYGGVPVGNLNPKYNTLLKLIERDFLSMFSGQDTPEKKLVTRTESSKSGTQKAGIDKPMPKPSYPEAKYLEKITIDFELLPDYIVRQGIIWHFEAKHMIKPNDYPEWKTSLSDFIDTIPTQYQEPLLVKGIEYASKALEYHNKHECKEQTQCQYNQSWERRIAVAGKMLESLLHQSTEHANNSKEEYKQEPWDYRHVPVIPITNAEGLWLKEVLKRSRAGERFSIRDIRSALHKQLPADFMIKSMDTRIISDNGEQITLLGIIALEKDFSFLGIVDEIMSTIKELILNDPTKTVITITEINEATQRSVADISLALRLIQDYGRFYSGLSSDHDNNIIKSIDIGNNADIYDQYIHYPGIGQLITLQSFKQFSQPTEAFSFEEMLAMNEKLDKIISDISTLKVGQEVIWEDVLKEINELKSLYHMGKKNWRQLLLGKLTEMTVGGVVSETLSKTVVESFKPLIEAVKPTVAGLLDEIGK